MQILMVALATGTGVGINALFSKSLGEQNYEKANAAAIMIAGAAIFLIFPGQLFLIKLKKQVLDKI